jgi:hypothetical protein
LSSRVKAALEPFAAAAAAIAAATCVCVWVWVWVCVCVCEPRLGGNINASALRLWDCLHVIFQRCLLTLFRHPQPLLPKGVV